MEQAEPIGNAELIDLSGVEADQRAFAWSAAVPSVFPGMSVRKVERGASYGKIARIAMGGGSLWSVRAPAACVSYAPSRNLEAQGMSVMLQRAGLTTVKQQSPTCEVAAGDLCVLDEQFPFQMEGSGDFIFLRMPRTAVLSRNPHLEHQTALPLLSVDPAVGLVGQTLSCALLAAPFLREGQRRAAVVAMIEMLGMIEMRGDEHGSSAWWRVQAALSFIELNFSRHELTADCVAAAQRISRRRLDQLLCDQIAITITGQIWKRRLDQAAADLVDPARIGSTASQIAFANGFEDNAHFTRAFKRAYGHPPSKWRHLSQRAKLPRPSDGPADAGSISDNPAD